MRSFVVDALLICAALSCAGQTSPEPYTFFKQSIGLQDGEIGDIQHGKAVTKALSTKTPAEVAVFGAVFIHASIEDYLKAAQNVNSLRGSPNYLGFQVFSTPPQLSDLQGFVLEEQDIKDLKNCQPGQIGDFEAHAKEKSAQTEIDTIKRLKGQHQEIDRKRQELKTAADARAGQVKAEIEADMAKLRSSLADLGTKFKKAD